MFLITMAIQTRLAARRLDHFTLRLLNPITVTENFAEPNHMTNDVTEILAVQASSVCMLGCYIISIYDSDLLPQDVVWQSMHPL